MSTVALQTLVPVGPHDPKISATLLGALTLEALGLALDPIRRELKPVTLLL